MQILESTLLTGPYDWDEKLIPESEFKDRGKQVWQKLGGAGERSQAECS